MLTISFFTAVFLTISWMMYIGTYIYIRLNGVSMAALGLTDLSIYAALTVLPLLVIWTIWNGFYRFRHEKNLQKQFNTLDNQVKQNQGYFEIVAKLLYQGQQTSQNNFIVGKIDLFINEMNGLLADMLQRYSFIADSEAARLWVTAEKGNKWGFAKALINLQNSSTDFDNRLFRTACRENLMRGTINEFCARYIRLIEILKKYDQEKIFLNIVETGAFGKAFAILAPVSDRLQNQVVPAAEIIEPELFADTDLRIDDNNNSSVDEIIAGLDFDNIPEFILPELTKTIESDNSTIEEVTENKETPQPVVKPEPIKKEKLAKQTDFSQEISALFGDINENRRDVNDEIKEETEAQAQIEKNSKVSFIPKIGGWFKRPAKDNNTKSDEIDPLTLALERSFGKLSDSASTKESRLYRKMAEQPSEGSEENKDSENKFGFSSTQQTIMKLHQELEELSNPNSQDKENGKAADASSDKE